MFPYSLERCFFANVKILDIGQWPYRPFGLIPHLIVINQRKRDRISLLNIPFPPKTINSLYLKHPTFMPNH